MKTREPSPSLLFELAITIRGVIDKSVDGLVHIADQAPSGRVDRIRLALHQMDIEYKRLNRVRSGTYYSKKKCENFITQESPKGEEPS